MKQFTKDNILYNSFYVKCQEKVISSERSGLWGAQVAQLVQPLTLKLGSGPDLRLRGLSPILGSVVVRDSQDSLSASAPPHPSSPTPSSGFSCAFAVSQSLKKKKKK